MDIFDILDPEPTKKMCSKCPEEECPAQPTQKCREAKGKKKRPSQSTLFDPCSSNYFRMMNPNMDCAGRPAINMKIIPKEKYN